MNIRRITTRGPVATLLLVLLLTACGEFYEFNTSSPVTAGEMSLQRRVVTMVVGDHYAIPVDFSPEELSNNAVFWLSEDDAIATFENDTLVALSEGLTRAFAFTTIDRLRDTCWVYVMPAIYMAPGNYPYDMVIYASVDVHGTRLTTDNAQPYIIAAFVGDELRGIGQMKRRAGIDYMEMRVWSPFTGGDEVRLRCYYRGQARAELFPDVFTFDGEMHGELTHLYPLVLGDDAEEYEPDVLQEDDNPIIELPDTTVVEIYD